MTGQVTNAELQSQINRLDEKVDERHGNNQKLLGDLATKMDTLIELNVRQRLQDQLIGQLDVRSQKHDEDIGKAQDRLVVLSERVRTQGIAWKIVGSVVMLSLGGVGWMLSQLKEYYQYQDRVDTLQFIVQGKPGPVIPPAQPTTSK